MAESDILFAEVAKLRQEVAEIKHTTTAQVRFNETLKSAVVSQLKGDTKLIQVFLAVDGVRSQKEIITFTGIDKSSVSRKLVILADLDLIEPIDKADSSIIYKATQFSKAINLKTLLKKQLAK